MSNQFADASSPAQLTPQSAGAWGSSPWKSSCTSFDVISIRSIKTLGLSRNSSWHYPRPSDKILKTVVKRYGDAEVALDVGDKMPGIRGLFADEIMLGVLSYYRPEDEDSFGELMHELAEITWRLVHFAQYAINDYMKRHSDKLDPPWPT